VPTDHELMTDYLADRDEPARARVQPARVDRFDLSGVATRTCHTGRAGRTETCAFVLAMCGLPPRRRDVGVFVCDYHCVSLTKAGERPPRGMYWPLFGIPSIGVGALGIAAGFVTRTRRPGVAPWASMASEGWSSRPFGGATIGLVIWFLSSLL